MMISCSHVSNELLIRIPLAGMSVHSYKTGGVNQIKKIGNIITRLALLAIGSLLMANIFHSVFFPFAVIALSGMLFVLFCIASSEKRRGVEFFLELMLASICMMLAFFALRGMLTFHQAGIGIVSTLLSGLVVGMIADRGKIREVNRLNDANHDTLLAEETVEQAKPHFLIQGIDYGIGLCRDSLYSFTSLLSSLTHQQHYASTIQSDSATTKLYVLIHGLASRPAVLDRFYDAILSLEANPVTIFQPFVKESGECSLEEASESIMQEIQQWSQDHPHLPIVYIVHSNGARIAGNISSKMKLEGVINPMQVHCVGGPFYGTTFVNQPNWPSPLKEGWKLLFKKLYSEPVYEELSWQSETAESLIRNMQRAAQSCENLHYYFYGSPSDILVHPYTSIFPNVAQSRYFLSSAEGHQGILSAAQDTIMDHVLQFNSNQ